MTIFRDPLAPGPSWGWLVGVVLGLAAVVAVLEMVVQWVTGHRWAPWGHGGIP